MRRPLMIATAAFAAAAFTVLDTQGELDAALSSASECAVLQEDQN